MIMHTPRLVLRPWQREDLHTMVAWPRYPDPLDDSWNWPHRLHEQGTTDLFFLTREADPTRHDWTIVTRDDTIVGYIGVRNIEPSERSGWLGIGFGYPYTGQGYGQEALTALLDASFGEGMLRVMRLEVAVHNRRAMGLYTRLGFQERRSFWREEGFLADWSFLDQPRYASIQPFVRRGKDSMLFLWREMELQAHTWQLQAGAAR